MGAVDNFMALEPELVARLRARLDALDLKKVHVLTAPDLDGVTEEKQLAPAVHVVYRDYSVQEVLRGGTVNRVGQTWLAVVVTRNTRSVRTGADARAQAGHIAQAVTGALCGWRPASATRALELANGPGAGFSGGHQYLPLAFQGEILLQAAT